MQYRNFKGIHFIRVQGDLVERTRAHAALMKPYVNESAIPALAKKNEWLIRRSPLLMKATPVQDLVVGFYRKIIMPILDANTPRTMKAAMQAASQEAGVPYEVLRETLFQADGLMLLVRASLVKHLLPEWMPGGFPACTSGVALKEATKNGSLLAGRNFDYLVVGPWEKHATVVFNEPTESDQVPFVNLTTAGVQMGGVTSMNRAGITLATHAHFGRRVSFRGQSIIAIGEEVISKAKTLDQAIDIVRKRKSCANWAFVVSSGYENRAAVIEISPTKVEVREPKDGILAHSNFFHDENLRETEALLCGGYCEDLQARYGHIQRVLLENRGQIEAHHLAKALGDQRDFFTGEERAIGNTLGVITTVKSTVFEPEKQRFWMASRSESPVGLGEYVEIDIERFWKMDLAEYERDVKSLPGYAPKNPKLVEGIRHHREAYRAYHMDNDDPNFRENAFAHMVKAVTAFPDDGHLWIQAGLLAFQLRKFEEGTQFFQEARKRTLSAHARRVCDLYLARAMDMVGQRKEALIIYQENKNAPEPKLRKAFRAGLRRRYRASAADWIHLDLQFPDSFEY